MDRTWAMLAAAITLGLVCACGTRVEPDTTMMVHRPSDMASERNTDDVDAGAIGFGWRHAITVDNYSAAVGKRNGSATSTIAGHSLHDLVARADVRVRADGNACSSCHDWATTETKADFCDRIDDFLALPTATGSASDPKSAKPKVLKDILERWQRADCPD